jgi:hypothetical protein
VQFAQTPSISERSLPGSSHHGADCGFASTLVPGQRPEVEPEIVWAKFRSLAEGARLARRQLWT